MKITWKAFISLIISFLAFIGGILFYAKFLDEPETVVNNHVHNENKIGKIKAKQGAEINTQVVHAAEVPVKLSDRLKAKIQENKQKRAARKAAKNNK